MFKAQNPGLKKVWMCWTSAPGVQQQLEAEAAAWQSIGIETVNQGPLPGNVADYTGAVVKAKQAGANGIDCFGTQVQVTAALAKAVVQQGWKPLMSTGYSVYDPKFPELAGSAANGWGYGTALPNLNAELMGSTQGGKDYIAQVGHPPQTASDYMGWEMMDLAVQALVKAGPNLTRKSFLDALSSFHNFGANGLVPPFDIGSKTENGTCFTLQMIEDGKFVQKMPDTGNQICGGEYFPK
jgi:ABC-type branched-subunit amino acid transport system substrate-binding protein